MNNLNILLVNNQSKSIESLHKFLLRFGNVNQIDFNKVSNVNAEEFDLIVLSGSSLIDPVNQSFKVKTELEWIRHSSVPIIGVCFGFELICIAFDCKLKRSEEKINDFRLITLSGDYFRKTSEPIAVKEYHQWFADSVNQEVFDVLATSESGIEIVKHKYKDIIGFQFHPELFTDLTQGDNLLESAIINLTR